MKHINTYEKSGYQNLVSNQTNDKSTTEITGEKKYSLKSDFGQMFQASREFANGIVGPQSRNPIDKSMTFTDNGPNKNIQRMHNSKNEGQTHQYFYKNQDQRGPNDVPFDEVGKKTKNSMLQTAIDFRGKQNLGDNQVNSMPTSKNAQQDGFLTSFEAPKDDINRQQNNNSSSWFAEQQVHSGQQSQLKSNDVISPSKGSPDLEFNNSKTQKEKKREQQAR